MTTPAAVAPGVTSSSAPVPGEPWRRGGPPPWAAASAPAAAPSPGPIPGAAPPPPSPYGQPMPPSPYGMPPPAGAAGPMPGTPMPGTPVYAPAPNVVIRKRRPLLNATLTVVCIVVVAFVGWGAFSFAFAERPPSALNGYLDGKGVQWTLPHTHTTVRMPAAPNVHPTHTTLGDTEANGTMATVVRNSYEMMFVAFDGFGHVDANKEPVLLDRAFHDAAHAFHVDLKTTKDTTSAGAAPRMVGHGSFHGDSVEGVITHQHGRLIVLLVHSKHGATRVLAELEKSLHVG